MRDIDWIGLWFEVLEKEFGEFMGIRYGRAPAGPGEPEWVFLRHQDFDGVGGFARLVGGNSESGALPAMPGLRQAAPSWPERKRLLIRHIAGRPVSPRQFRSFDPAWRPRDPESSRPLSVSWHRFSREETERLLARARSRELSLNSLLLWGVARAAASRLADGPGPMIWMVPVNMREVVRNISPTANHAAFVDVKFPADAGPEQIHAVFRGVIERNAHWGAWEAMSLGRWLGRRGMTRVVGAELSKGLARLGGFSNLGAWQPESPEKSPGDWLFCPPVSRLQPVGAGAVSWNGRLGIALQLHPALTRDPEEAARWLRDWRASLETELTAKGAPAC